MSAMANTTPLVTTVTKPATNPRDADATPRVNIQEFCEEYYEDILPIIMDKVRRHRRKDVHTRLDFREGPKERIRVDSHHSSARARTTKPERLKLKDRLRYGDHHVLDRLDFRGHHRGRSRPHRLDTSNEDCSKDRERFRGVGESYDDSFSHSYRDGNHSRHMKRKRDNESSLSSVSKSNSSDGRYQKSRSKRHKSTDEDDLTRPWMCEDEDPFTPRIQTGRMKGAPECMRISGFMHGVNNPELTKRLSEHVPKTMEEMMITPRPSYEEKLLLAKRNVTHHGRDRTSQKGKHHKKCLTFGVTQWKEGDLTGSLPLQGRQKRFLRPRRAEYVIREIHEGSCSMHAGPRSVVAKAIRLGYYWPTVHQDARDMIRKCNDCQIHRPVTRNPQQPLTPITTLWPFYKWGIDIVGPFPEGPGKVKFLIVAMDYFTKLIEAKIVATITGSQVEELPHILWAHRTMIKSSHGDTPFSLTYETEAVIPTKIVMPTHRTAAVDVMYDDEELRLNLDLLEERHEHAAIRKAKAKLKMTKYYNACVRGVTFRPGDFVYCSNDASHAVAGGKLGPKWEGPYEVTKALGDGAYKMRSTDGTVLLRTWNIANLKRCYL
nr:hypothetical protein [Tanacetum cinerariifolium]